MTLEPDVLHNSTDYDIDTKLQSYLDGKTQYELLSKELEENYYKIIESIKKYGGFYIGRYETGGLNGTALVRKMDTNIGGQTWYTMYEKCKSLEGNNDNVMISMIWGSLWDETLQWLIDVNAKTSAGTVLTYQSINNSTTYGNYYYATFNYIPANSELPEETETKTVGIDLQIPAGSSESTKINNIYDLAGNVWEWTLEANSTNRGYRGGGYDSGSYSIGSRMYINPNDVKAYRGCRAVLLIK